jgi:hypothetical protein
MAAVRKVSLAFALMVTTNEVLKQYRHIEFNTETDHKHANTLRRKTPVRKSTIATWWAISPSELVESEKRKMWKDGVMTDTKFYREKKESGF